jgi:hypothetical protein
MAERPIFVSRPASAQSVEEIFLQLKWHPGFARVQKEKNIRALHEAAAAGQGTEMFLRCRLNQTTLVGKNLVPSI